MTKRLILIRHAKSSWEDNLDDHDRVLNLRGRSSAAAIGMWLEKNGYHPDVMLCSDAARTQETMALIAEQLSGTSDMRLLPALYHAAPDTVLDLIGKETAAVVAVIGHNPGIGIAANMLVNTPPDHHRFSDYPTCATTIIDFDTPLWAGAQFGTGNCVDFVVPRNLIGTGNDID